MKSDKNALRYIINFLWSIDVLMASCFVSFLQMERELKIRPRHTTLTTSKTNAQLGCVAACLLGGAMLKWFMYRRMALSTALVE